MLKNYFSATGGTKILFNCLKHQDVPDIRNYLNLISDQEFKIIVDAKQFNVPKEWKYLKKDFKQIAFDAGYLTMGSSMEDLNQIILKVPNYMVFENLQDLLQNSLKDNDKFGLILSNLMKKNFNNNLKH